MAIINAEIQSAAELTLTIDRGIIGSSGASGYQAFQVIQVKLAHKGLVALAASADGQVNQAIVVSMV